MAQSYPVDLSGIIAFLGGIGLFLLGMRLMTEGLKASAGHGLRDLLSRGTTTRVRALGSGLAITALVQSSSAVTFATIGFVNAGLLSLPQAVGVIYGANVGTTVTSWLVALVGFKLDLKALALPAIAVGMGMRVAFGSRREGAFGEALAGFGVFFMGIDVLKDAFSGMAAFAQPDLPAATHRLLPFIGVGFLMTLVMQSSSAALVITLSAAATGVLPLQAAAAMVIGANVGTTTTAVFAVIGATSAAKRAAAAHVIFNLVVAAVAMLLLPIWLWLIEGLGLAMQGVPLAAATALALFHTLTKLSGVLVMWPFTDRITGFLETRFRKADIEDAWKPRHLDRTIAATPTLALNAATMELAGAIEGARRIATRAITVPREGWPGIREESRGLHRLVGGIGEFAAAIHDPERADCIARALRVNQYLADISERTEEYFLHGEAAGSVDAPELASVLRELNTLAHAALADVGDPRASQAEFESRYQAAKAALLRAGAEQRLKVRQMVAALDQISALRRLVDQFAKATRVFAELQSSLSTNDLTA